MAKSRDEIDNRLYYTEKLGWIDVGHSDGKSASILYHKIKNEINEALPVIENNYLNKRDFFFIEYHQDHVISFFHSGFTTYWAIRKGLSESEKKSIALSIFLFVSLGFEMHQSSFPQKIGTGSGFSCEDLVSNVLGFYSKIEPKDYSVLMKRHSKEYALRLWDYYGPIENYKSYDLRVLYFPDPAKSIAPLPHARPLPVWLSTIPIIDLENSDNVYRITEHEYWGIISGGHRVRLFTR